MPVKTGAARRRSNFILLLGLAVFLLSGCGSAKVEELRAYREAMTDFYDRLGGYDRAIRGIDPGDGDASEDFLSVMDAIAADCLQITTIETPEEYLPVQENSIRLSRDMQLARDAFHDAFDGESFDAGAFERAMESYESANDGLREMIRLLREDA